MQNQIDQLRNIAYKSERTIIGLMSGTSLDGLDIALCKIKGNGKETSLELIHFCTKPYTEKYRSYVRQVFSKRNVDLQHLTGLNAWIGKYHARLIMEALREWGISPKNIDLIASHGQTIYHAPQSLTQDDSLPNSTLQIGDADHIAMITGIFTISDFRQKHIAAGGEGAPLAAYGDSLLFQDDIQNRVLLNIGGISNFTFIPKHNSDLQIFASDIGPGNTMMNQYMQTHFDQDMDKDATLAKTGAVEPYLLTALLSHPFFDTSFPKTTGPELFNLDYLEECLKKANTSDITHQDAMRTLCEFSAVAIAQSIKSLSVDCHVYISGGGLHNPLLYHLITKYLSGYPVSAFTDLGMDPDAKEACLFAVLANETITSSRQKSYGIQNSPNVYMGKISLPY